MNRLHLSVSEFILFMGLLHAFLFGLKVLAAPGPGAYFTFPSPSFDHNQCVIPHIHQPGTCVKFSDCGSAQFDWRTKRIHPTTCYFEKFDPFVCCSISEHGFSHTHRPAEPFSSVPPHNAWPNKQGHKPPGSVTPPQHGSWPPQNLGAPQQGSWPPQNNPPPQRLPPQQGSWPPQNNPPPQRLPPQQGSWPPQNLGTPQQGSWPPQSNPPPQQLPPQQGSWPPQNSLPQQNLPSQEDSWPPQQNKAPPQQGSSSFQNTSPPQNISPQLGSPTFERIPPPNNFVPPQGSSSFQNISPPNNFVPPQGSSSFQNIPPPNNFATQQGSSSFQNIPPPNNFATQQGLASFQNPSSAPTSNLQQKSPPQPNTFSPQNPVPSNAQNIQNSQLTTPTPDTSETESTTSIFDLLIMQLEQERANAVPSRTAQRNCEANYEKEIDFGKVAYVSVVGGELAGKDEFPYMAALGWRRADNQFEFNCGGFLVSKNFVLTAAHCASLGGAPPDVVRIGGDSLALNTSDPDIPIERLFVHPDYKTSTIYNDIALIKMTQESTKLHACLWLYDDIIANYTVGTAIGYGDTQFAGARSSNLLKVDLQFISNDNCSDFYKPQSDFPMGLISSQLCASDPTMVKDTCQGDSGGPILIRSFYKSPYVVGITSFGDGCAGPTPSIYTRISSYIDWIESVVWPDQDNKLQAV